MVVSKNHYSGFQVIDFNWFTALSGKGKVSSMAWDLIVQSPLHCFHGLLIILTDLILGIGGFHDMVPSGGVRKFHHLSMRINQ